MNSPEARITVHKLDAHGVETWRYSGRRLELNGGRIRLEAAFDRPDEEFRSLRLRRGDRFVETFYTDRWYNVFAVHDVDDDRLKGWYCNITRPARLSPDGEHLYAEDLALDLIVLPDGRWQVLDEEEYAALDIPLEERRQALRALAELQAMAMGHRGPFAPGPGRESAAG
jgi:uncharacterized protein